MNIVTLIQNNGKSETRNKVLANLFKELELIGKWVTGIKGNFAEVYKRINGHYKLEGSTIPY